MCKENQSDIQEIISHRYDNGFDYWTTIDRKLLKGAPFTTLESPLYLLETGISPTDSLLNETSKIIFESWREDGRFKITPTGAIYPCQTALSLKTLCYLGYENDDRVKASFNYFFKTQENDGGWKCNKYSFGHGSETNYSTPVTTLTVLDAFRYSRYINSDEQLAKAVNFLLSHWEIKKPIGPCHHGIGTLFMQVEYPFRSYNSFY